MEKTYCGRGLDVKAGRSCGIRSQYWTIISQTLFDDYGPKGRQRQGLILYMVVYSAELKSFRARAANNGFQVQLIS